MADRFDPAALAEPIVLAPLGGGPSTPALAAAVSDAGGLGVLAAAYLTPGAFADQVAALKAATSRPFGVNLFVPVASADRDAVPAYLERLEAEAAARGVALGQPAELDDDGWDAKLELVLRERPAVVSFTFAPPPSDVVAALHAQGIAVWASATTPAEAAAGADAGVDAVVAQGVEAGGHRAGSDDPAAGDLGVLALLQLCSAATDLPLVAAGGIATGAGVAGVLAAGAVAAALGTAFMRAPQAGTPEPYRRALADAGRPTALTRAFSGRTARGIVNRFLSEHTPAAPRGWPQVNRATAPLRAAARAEGDAESLSLWAGQSYALATDEDAGALVRRLGAEARDALSLASARRPPRPRPAAS